MKRAILVSLLVGFIASTFWVFVIFPIMFTTPTSIPVEIGEPAIEARP